MIDQIGKDPDLEVTANGPRLMEFLRELNRETFGGANLVTVGEAWGANVDRARQYSAPDGSIFSMVFQFEQMVLDQDGSKWDAKPLPLPALKASIARWQNGLHGRGWNSLFWEQPRPAPHRQPLGATTANPACRPPRRWRWRCTACRARPTSTRARSWA